MKEPALVFDRVTRSFGKRTALRDVSLRAEPGQVVGLVGRNGAGKTTALRLAHGMLFPDAGSIRILGLDPIREGREVRTRVALLSEEASLYPWMTVEEIVRFAGRLHPRWDATLAGRLLRDLSLEPGERITTLSRGSRAKVSLVLAAASRPDLLLLDDPTAGLDPLVRREVLEGVLDMVSADGGAVVYASHLIHDVERVADRIAFVDGGRLALEGDLEDLKARIRRARAVFEDDAPAAIALPGQIDCAVDGRLLSVVADSANGDLQAGLLQLGARNVEVESLSLEEILVACLKGTQGREVQGA